MIPSNIFLFHYSLCIDIYVCRMYPHVKDIIDLNNILFYYTTCSLWLNKYGKYISDTIGVDNYPAGLDTLYTHQTSMTCVVEPVLECTNVFFDNDAAQNKTWYNHRWCCFVTITPPPPPPPPPHTPPPKLILFSI